jgi:CubicO group peptidase (beta-lactamase class C family)
MRATLKPAFPLCLILLAAPLAAQDVTATLDSVFGQWNRVDGPGCAAGVDLAGARTTRAWGMANLEYGVALTPESVLESGSVAKQFTAAAVGLLALRGRLSLDDDVRKYIPEVPDFGRPITVRMILQHTSGLRDQWALLSIQGFPPGREVHDFDRILDLVKHQQRLNFEPGAEYLYSNTGFALAAMLVTRVAGKPFAEFTREELFLPLGMTKTQWRDDYRRVVPDRATAYARTRTGWVQDMPFTMVHGNGGLLTTVGDMLTWNDALTTGRIPGGPELVRMLETPGRLNDGSPITYALGLTVDAYRGLREVSHGGSTAGYRTFLVRWPERALSVAVFCNAATANPTGHARAIADRLLGLRGVELPPSPAVPIATAELGRLAGAYRDSTTDQFVTFVVREGALAVSGGGGAAALTYLGNLRFWSPAAGEYRFEPDGAGYRVVNFQNAWRRYARHTPIDTASVRLAAYVGSYRSPELEVTVDLVAESGRLLLRQRPAEEMPLTPIYTDGFAAQGQTIRFTRDESGGVTGFRVFAGRARDVRFDKAK